jgi:Domain of unknown function (DUF4386)
VPGDAARSAANVVANPGLVRIGVVADLLQATVFVFLAMVLYLLPKDGKVVDARFQVITSAGTGSAAAIAITPTSSRRMSSGPSQRMLRVPGLRRD